MCIAAKSIDQQHVCGINVTLVFFQSYQQNETRYGLFRSRRTHCRIGLVEHFKKTHYNSMLHTFLLHFNKCTYLILWVANTCIVVNDDVMMLWQ